jgi:hypothetical protein
VHRRYRLHIPHEQPENAETGIGARASPVCLQFKAGLPAAAAFMDIGVLRSSGSVQKVLQDAM